MHNIKILFVDDEPNVLAAIKRMLRSKRDTWEMTFAEGSTEALALFETIPFDIIISDIRMPGMDGAELLNRIKDNYPGVIRIALSGQVDLNEVMRSIRAVHQYIPKPCNAELLIRKVEGAILSREVLTDPHMQQLVSEVDTLPVIPKVFHAIEKELQKEEPSIEKIAQFIAMDVGFLAKTLKLINSPYFGLPSHIDSIFQAITLLGLETIKALVLSTHLFSMYDKTKLPHFSLDLLWNHCFRVSNIARLIAQCEGLDNQTVTNARMTGLLHDVGKLILANNFPVRYQNVISAAKNQTLPIHECEMAEFNTTHAQLGAYLMGLWGMPGDVIHGIGFHHQYEEHDFSVCMLVAVADVIDHHCVIIHPDYARLSLNKKILPEGQRGKQLEKWISYIKAHWDGIDTFQADDSSFIELLAK